MDSRKPSPTQQATLPPQLPRDTVAPAGKQAGLCLIALTGPAAGQVIELTHVELSIGRGSEASIQILDGSVSRQHARLWWNAPAGCHMVEDLGSSFGTRVNELKLAGPHPVRPGDRITLGGTTVLRVSHRDDPEARFASRMIQAVLRDPLTGAFNRRYLEQRLQEEVAFARRHAAPLALVFLDIDHFKRINDTYDHQVGDEVLKEVTRRILATVRTEDVLVRYGGEEFALICRQTAAAEAAVVAERIRVAVQAASFAAGDDQLEVTVSLGVAASTPGTEPLDPTGLVGAADRAMLQAKSSGRNRVVCV